MPGTGSGSARVLVNGRLRILLVTLPAVAVLLVAAMLLVSTGSGEDVLEFFREYLPMFMFATLGVLSGLLASIGASIAGVYVANRVLQIPYTPDPWVWIYGIIGGGLLVCLAGWLATRSVVNQPPVLTLRSG